MNRKPIFTTFISILISVMFMAELQKSAPLAGRKLSAMAGSSFEDLIRQTAPELGLIKRIKSERVQTAEANTWEGFVEFLGTCPSADPSPEDMAWIGFRGDLPVNFASLVENVQVGVYAQFNKGRPLLASLMQCTGDDALAHCIYYVVDGSGNLKKGISSVGSDAKGWKYFNLTIDADLIKSFTNLKSSLIRAKRRSV